MPPPSDRARRALLRSATTRAASSRDSAPATQAAAISPWEWPTTAPGSTPYARHRPVSDTITAKRTGWTTSTRSKVGASSSARSTARSDQSTYGARACSHSAIRSANTGCVSISSAPMPAHWEPWPGKTNTARVSASWAAYAAADESSASARSASRSAPRSPTSAARCSKAVRVWRVRPMSAGCAPGSSARCRLSRRAWARRASGVRADSGHRAGAPSGPGRSAGPGSGSGACSRMVWTLVPLSPKDDTPARAGRPLSGQERGSVARARAPRPQSTWVDGRSMWRVGGTVRCRMARTVLMTPATPEAAWVWPMLDFSEPTSNGRSAGRS